TIETRLPPVVSVTLEKNGPGICRGHFCSITKKYVDWRGARSAFAFSHSSPLTPRSSAQTRLRPRDHQPLDLAGALVDLGDLGVAEVALQRHLLGITHAAVDLHRLVADPHRRFGRGELGHCRLGAEATAMLFRLTLGPRRAQGQQGRRIQLA